MVQRMHGTIIANIMFATGKMHPRINHNHIFQTNVSEKIVW